MITVNSYPLPKNEKPSYLAPTLASKSIQKVDFDPTNSEHRQAYVDFVHTRKWNIHFNTKWPMSVEATVASQLARMACEEEWPLKQN